MSYHLTEITKGVLGELSKIQEELDEVKDAEEQKCKIMIGCELSDLYGAVEAYAEKYNLSMSDLNIMNEATKRAFKSGRRSSDENINKTEQYTTIKVQVTKEFIKENFNVSYYLNNFYILDSKKTKNIIIVPVNKIIVLEIDDISDINITDINDNIHDLYKFKVNHAYHFNNTSGVYTLSYVNDISIDISNISLHGGFGTILHDVDDWIIDHIFNTDCLVGKIMKVSNLW